MARTTRQLHVRHTTPYTYDHPIQRSTHRLHLRPIADWERTVLGHSLETTPYQVLVSKRGVCQDFANLFICMARLLGLPARYVCGYLHTGPSDGMSRATSDASHAWVQLYIPTIGWKGFDPTNGVLPRT